MKSADAMNSDVEVLIVEDSPIQAEELRHLLEKQGHRVLVTHNGQEALDVMREHKPTMVISDIVMPVMDGYELCRQIKQDEELKDVPVILLTFLSDPTDVIKSLEYGAHIFVTKPYSKSSLLARIQDVLEDRQPREAEDAEGGIDIFFAGQRHVVTSDRKQILALLLATFDNAVQKSRELDQTNKELVKTQLELRTLNEELERRVEERTAELVQANVELIQEIIERKRAEEGLEQSYVRLQRALEGTINTLVSAIEMKDPYTAGHQRRVAELACAIAQELALPEEQIEGIRMAGLIHDLGKITVPAEILSKPSQLNKLEWGMIKMHPQVGYDVLKAVEFPWPVAEIVLQHHERLDGSGYPAGLSSEAIIVEARILAVADVVEAMASHRPYRPALGMDKALEEISQNRGGLYDLEVVDACLRLFTAKRFTLE